MNDGPTFELHFRALHRIDRELLGPLAEGGARILVNHIKTYMEDAPPRTGHVYLIPGTSTPYTASAPGEPPAIRTAAYRDSWEPTPAVIRGDFVAAAAVTSMRDDFGELLGETLEFGYGIILPRPHIRPAMRAATGEIDAMLRRFERTAA